MWYLEDTPDILQNNTSKTVVNTHRVTGFFFNLLIIHVAVEYVHFQEISSEMKESFFAFILSMFG